MPEGPEIRRAAERIKSLEDSTILNIRVLSGRYMKNGVPAILEPAGQKVKKVRVRGKLIGIYLEDHVILSTAGMSGHWVKDPDPVKHERIRIWSITDEFKNQSFTFGDQRNFGTFKVVSKLEADIKFASLGLDVFDELNLPELKKRIEKFGQYQPICESLLEQRIFAGVGNYIRAEAMYLAKINPRDRTDLMTDEQLTRLWSAIHEVAAKAYELEHNYKDLCYHREVADDGRLVENFKDGNGRTVWFCAV